MPFVPSFEPARRRLNAARADALIAKIDAMEGLAEAWEEADGSAAERLSARYEKVIGIDPALRQGLRARLEMVLASGVQSVQDAIDGARQSSRDTAAAGGS